MIHLFSLFGGRAPFGPNPLDQPGPLGPVHVSVSCFFEVFQKQGRVFGAQSMVYVSDFQGQGPGPKIGAGPLLQFWAPVPLR